MSSRDEDFRKKPRLLICSAFIKPINEELKKIPKYNIPG